MLKVVLDTNVLVSALLVAESNPAQVLSRVLIGKDVIYYDSRIFLEYKRALYRPKFPFQQVDVDALLDRILQIGISILAEPVDDCFEDAADKKFFEVAKSSGAFLITGNGKHFPHDELVVSPAEFLGH